MVDILHKVGVKSSPAAVYEALTALDRLAGWWTTDTKGGGDRVGDVIAFRFDAGAVDMKVVELTPGKRVLWVVVRGPSEWIGTKIHWDLAQECDYVAIRFKHEGWREPSDFMHHCSTKWATFLMSLKALVETGKGAPFPNDLRVINADF